MNPAYQDIIDASDEDRRGLFLTTATRLGTTLQNIEKDFWVCWTLDALFHRLPEGGPRLLFKGGTSLSKAFNLISRFSEDIDITVFREDLGRPASFADLEALSRRRRTQQLDAIRQACQTYIAGDLRTQLSDIAADTMSAASRRSGDLTITLDEADPDRQSLLVHYPSVADAGDYIAPSVKIESGAKSALDPHEARTIAPYVSADIPTGEALAVEGVTTIDPDRTFLDKVLIVHGMTFYFAATGNLRGNGRMSRHYYDIHRLMQAGPGAAASQNDALVEDCVRHARMFFYRSNTGLEGAERGAFRLTPSRDMAARLKRDYDAMATMIFGDVPDFGSVMESIGAAEELLNKV